LINSSIRFEDSIRKRIGRRDSIRDSIRTKKNDSQVPTCNTISCVILFMIGHIFVRNTLGHVG